MKSIILLFIFSNLFSFSCCAQKQAVNKSTLTPELLIDPTAIFLAEASPDAEKTLIGYREYKNDNDSKKRRKFILISNKDKKTLIGRSTEDKILEPRWSPDGKWIAYIKLEDKRVSLEIMDVSTFSPFTIYTALPNHSIDSLQWSPDGKHITFLDTRDIDSPRIYKLGNFKVAYEVNTDAQPSRLLIISIDLENKIFSGPLFLTPETLTVTNDCKGHNEQPAYAWSPDNLSLAFSFLPTNEKQKKGGTSLAIVDIVTGKIKKLKQAAAALNPAFSPDGKKLAFVLSTPMSDSPINNENTTITSLSVCLLDLKTKKRRFLAKTPNEKPQILGWSTDGSYVIVQDTYRTTRTLYSLPIDGEDLVTLPLGKISSFYSAHLNAPGTHITFIGESSFLPPEAYISPLKNFKPEKITDFHKNVSKIHNLKMEIITWPSFDEKIIEGILTYPVNYKKGTQVPLIVLLRGGPGASWEEDYLGFSRGVPPSLALYATHGFAVLRPNIRGCNGYGAPFREAIYRDWGPGPYKDIMFGVDYLIKADIADPEKLAIGGGSYGGYLTAFTITQTDRFKAALVTAAVTDLISQQTSPFIDTYFGGSFWENYKTWEKNSPILFVENIKTPTLIQHGKTDNVVMASQGAQFYSALKERNVPVKMINYTHAGHEFEKNETLIGTQETLEWLDRYVLRPSH